MSAPAARLAIPAVVIDTNIALDLLLFADAGAQALRHALDEKQLQWIATAAMREELARVLGYPQIAPRLAYYQRRAEDLLARFDALALLRDAAPRASVVCKDPDDQRFIDLAVAHRAPLISKDLAVLALARRLERLGVSAGPRWPFF